MPLTKLPPQLQEIVLALKPGEISEPLPLQSAVALFQMRGVREVEGAAPRYSQQSNTQLFTCLADARPRAWQPPSSVVDRVDTCEDFYGLAQGQDPSVLDYRKACRPRTSPGDIALGTGQAGPPRMKPPPRSPATTARR